MEDGGFELVTKGHRLCSRKRNALCVKGKRPEISTKPCKEIYTRLVELKSQEIVISYSSQLKVLLQSSCCAEIVCYGIGRICEDITAQYQLAVLLVLVQQLKVKRVLLYDPVLSVEEKKALERLGVEMIKTNELCRRPVTVSTLFFMIHCDKAMYNNLLYSNWSTTQLNNVTIIGNSFSSYYLRLTEKQLMEEGYYIHMIKGGYKEVPLPLFPVPNVFNDTSVHTFPLELLQFMNHKIWKDNPVPVLDPNNEEILT